jgi:hypothetical protein
MLALALVAVVAAACGGGGASSTSNPTAAPTASSAPSQAAASAGSGTGTGKVDCAMVKEAGAELVIGPQILAQMRTPDAVKSVKDKVVGNFDADKFIAAMQGLHVLDGYPSPLGGPKPAIDAYIAAGIAAKDLLAKASVTQAEVDAFYTTNVGSISAFLGKQMAISGAMSAAGC